MAHPENAVALQLFGLLLSQLGQYEPAIRFLRESLRLQPGQAEVANNLGNALSRTGRLEEAAAAYADAIGLAPDYADAWRNLGLCQTRAGLLDAASVTLERCLDIHPKDAVAWLALGNVRREQGDVEAAIACFDKALEARPEYAEAHHNLGVSLRLQQRPAEALRHYDRAAELGLDRTELHQNRGSAYIDLRMPDMAINAYRAAIERAPTDPESHHMLNSLLWQQGQVDDYLRSYEVALAKYPAAVELRLAFGRALNQTESYEKAEQVLRDGLSHSAGSSELKALLAHTLEGQGRWAESLELHNAAVNMPGAGADDRISYGRALLACGRPEEALRQIEAGAGLAPLNQRALAYLGLCWRLLGDERDRTLNDYEQMVRVYELPAPSGYDSAPVYNRQLQAYLETLHIFRQHPAEQTLRGGSQTSGELFDRHDPEIVALTESLRVCIADYIARFPQDDEHPLYRRRRDDFEFAASWSVRLQRAGYHRMHTHPLGWISSAYYVQVPAVVADGDRHGGGIKFGQPDIDIGDQGAARRTIQPASGRLVLFPSYMWHGTVPFEADEPRMTVAFDVVPAGRTPD